MSITDADIAELAALIDQGRDAWINGHFDDSGPMQADDATIFGPFGGVAPQGVAPRVRPDVQRKVATRFGGGSGSTDIVRYIVEGDLVVVVYIDRSTVRFDCADVETPWMLRIFMRDSPISISAADAPIWQPLSQPDGSRSGSSGTKSSRAIHSSHGSSSADALSNKRRLRL